MRFLQLSKLLKPKAFRFSTFILLFLPSVKPFEYGTLNDSAIPQNHRRNAFVQSSKSGISKLSTNSIHYLNRLTDFS